MFTLSLREGGYQLTFLLKEGHLSSDFLGLSKSPEMVQQIFLKQQRSASLSTQSYILYNYSECGEIFK